MAWSAFEPVDARTFLDSKYTSRTGTEEQLEILMFEIPLVSVEDFPVKIT